MPEEKQEAIKNFISGTAENIMKMTPEQKKSMAQISYKALEPELRGIKVEDFKCTSYYEFLCQIVLAAAFVDKDFALEEEKVLDDIMETIGLFGQPFAEDIEKINKTEFDLSELSGKLKPESRGMFATFIALIFMGDNELVEDEYNMMINILAP